MSVSWNGGRWKTAGLWFVAVGVETQNMHISLSFGIPAGSNVRKIDVSEQLFCSP